MIRKILPPLAVGLAAVTTSQAALLIHYSFDSGAVGPLATGAIISNSGTSGTDGTAAVSGGSLSISDDAGQVNAALGNYLDLQPDSDGNEALGSPHISAGSMLTQLGISGATDYTMAAWVNFDNSTGDNMVFGGASGDVLHNGSRGGAYHGGHWGDDIQGGSNDPGNWHHVTWTNTGQTQEIFVDGVAIASGGAGASGGFNNNLGETLLVGTSRNGGSFRGSLDDVAVFSTRLNDFQIAAIHTLAIHPDYGYDASEVDRVIQAYEGGAGGAVTISGTVWEFAQFNPGDGRFFIQLGSNASGMVGNIGPPIFTFSADHALIPTGTPITLSWDVGTDAVSLTIDQGIGDVLPITTDGTGQITVDPGPLANTTYTLSASNAIATNMSTTTVTVTDQPIIESFTASQPVVAPDTPVQLDWSVLNADRVELDGDDVAGRSSLSVTPSSTTTWTLTAFNANGMVTAETRVTVVIPGEPLISEISANNQSGPVDEDGDNSDWIELANPTALPAILHDYYLSDDPNNLAKWRIPNMTLGGNQTLIIFASGKDRAVAGAELHTNFALRAGWRVPGTEQDRRRGDDHPDRVRPFPDAVRRCHLGQVPGRGHPRVLHRADTGRGERHRRCGHCRRHQIRPGPRFL